VQVSKPTIYKSLLVIVFILLDGGFDTPSATQPPDNIRNEFPL